MVCLSCGPTCCPPASSGRWGTSPETDDDALTEEERWFAERTRSANTRRAYRADLADFAGWCEQASRCPPAPPPSAPT